MWPGLASLSIRLPQLNTPPQLATSRRNSESPPPPDPPPPVAAPDNAQDGVISTTRSGWF